MAKNRSYNLQKATTLYHSTKVVGFKPLSIPLAFWLPGLLRVGHMGSQVLSPEYDMDVYMATLFGSEAWVLC